MQSIEVRHGHNQYTTFKHIGMFKLLKSYNHDEQLTRKLVIDDFESLANFPKGAQKFTLCDKISLDSKFNSDADISNHFELVFDNPEYGNVLGVNYILGNLKYTGDANRIIRNRLGSYVSNWRITADNHTNRHIHFRILRELLITGNPVDIYAKRAPRIQRGVGTHLMTKDLEYQIQAFNELEWNKENTAVATKEMKYLDYDFGD